MTAMADDIYHGRDEPEISGTTALLRLMALPLMLLALPLFLVTGWGYEAWALGAFLFVAQMAIQWGANKFIIGLPQTVAVGVAGVAVLTRAWGVMINLIIAVRTAGEDVAIPAAPTASSRPASRCCFTRAGRTSASG